MDSLPSLSAPYTYFHQLLDDPLVFVISAGILFDSGVALAIQKANGGSCHIVVQPSWNLYWQAKEIAFDIFKVREKHQHAQFIVLCPTIQEVELLLSLGIKALHVHKNAFIDEKIFHPITAIKKQYAAVYIANVEKFKRHSLAWNIRNIAVVTYSYKANSDLSELQGYKHLAFSNFSPSSDAVILGAPLMPSQVNRIICASCSGLMLSAEEGTNNASTEYLLSGVPVISTPSIGGREEFFDSRHVRIVQASPDSIEAAVEYYLAHPLDPLEVRESILDKIKPHRIRFLNWLCEVSKRDLFLPVDQYYWSPNFVNKLRITTSIDLGQEGKK